jgi:MFS family permease
MVAPGPAVGRTAKVGLAVLFVIYTLNFLDRSLIYILFKPIKAELALTDLELALLGSTAFVLFYTVLGVPFGRLADRVSRIALIAAGLATWSIASALTGAAPSFALLLACRIGVGVGEATLGPAAYSLLADWFPSDRRATAAALFSAGIPLGAGIAMALGGVLADTWGWRAAFPVLGLPGLLFAGLLLLLREPPRGAVDRRPAANEPGLIAVLRGSRVLQLHVLGYSLFNVASAAWAMWVPTYLAGRWDRPLSEVGPIVGLCAVGGGLVGTTLGGVAADAVRKRFVGGRLAFSSGAAVVSGLSWLALLGTADFGLAVAVTAVGMGLALAWLGPASADIQDLVPASGRATAISLYYFGVNLLGYGVGPPLIGALDDLVGVDVDPSRMALSLLVCPAACAAGAAVLAVASAAQRRATARVT